MNQFKFCKYFILLISMLLVSGPICSQAAQAIIIDHTCTDISKNGLLDMDSIYYDSVGINVTGP